jgi:hypothetical protein
MVDLLGTACTENEKLFAKLYSETQRRVVKSVISFFKHGCEKLTMPWID